MTSDGGGGAGDGDWADVTTGSIAAQRMPGTYRRHRCKRRVANRKIAALLVRVAVLIMSRPVVCRQTKRRSSEPQLPLRLLLKH